MGHISVITMSFDSRSGSPAREHRSRLLPQNPHESALRENVDRLTQHLEEMRVERVSLTRNMEEMRRELHSLRDAQRNSEFIRSYGPMSSDNTAHRPVTSSSYRPDNGRPVAASRYDGIFTQENNNRAISRQSVGMDEAFIAEPYIDQNRQDDIDEWLIPSRPQAEVRTRPSQSPVQQRRLESAVNTTQGHQDWTISGMRATPTPASIRFNQYQAVDTTPNMTTTQYYDSQLGRTKQRSKESVCDLPRFNGDGSLKIFRQQFMDVSYMSGWDNEVEMVFWLKQSLTGRARDVLYDACSSLDSLWSRLESRFGDHLLLNRYQNALPARKRQKNEALTELASDIRRMSDIVYDGIDAMQKEKLAIQHFVNALSSPEACYDITGKRPSSLEEALEIAMNREIYFGRETVWDSNKGRSQGQQNGQFNAPSSVAYNPPQQQFPQGMMSGPPPQWNMAPPQQWNNMPNRNQGNMPPPAPFYNQPAPAMPAGPAPAPTMPFTGPNNMATPSNGMTNNPGPGQYNNRKPRCKHCGNDHPSFICQPCRHCKGPHYDNKCPERNGMGNSRPIS